jgi:hypothetical protein
MQSYLFLTDTVSNNQAGAGEARRNSGLCSVQPLTGVFKFLLLFDAAK